MSSSFLSIFKSKKLSATIFRGGVGVLALRILGIVFSLLISMVLARFLGVEEYGTYSYVLATVTLLVIPAQFGLSTLIVRETSYNDSLKRWPYILGVWHWSTKIVLLTTVLLTILAVLVVYVLDDYRRESFLIGFLLIPVIALSSLRAAALQGLRSVVYSQFPENFVKPLFFLLFISILSLRSIEASARTVLLLQLFATVIAFFVGAIILNTLRPKETKQKIKPIYESKKWRKAILPMALADGVGVINMQADIIMLGLLTTSVQVGYYAIAATGAALIMTGINVLVVVTTPYITRFSQLGERNRLRKLVTNVSRIGFLISLPIFLSYVFFGELFIACFYGEEFIRSYLPLIILSVAYLFKSSFGLEARILNMLGHEKDNLVGAVLVTLSNLILNFLLIKRYGATGAALATAISIVLQNILYWIMVKIRLGIDSSIIGFHSKKEKTNV